MMIASDSTLADEQNFDTTLRPQHFSEYVGQEKIKRHLDIFIQAAKKREESIDHVLLYGPAGLGKTTLAHIIAKEMVVNIKVTLSLIHISEPTRRTPISYAVFC